MVVKLKARNNQCEREIQKVVDVLVLTPPNLITPNGDDRNDVFQIEGLPPATALEIRNRWGEKVYSSNNYKNDWAPSEQFEYGFFKLSFADGGGCTGWVKVLK